MPSATSSTSSDPLQAILAKLESMQGRTSSLEKSLCTTTTMANSAVSSEVNIAEAVSGGPGPGTLNVTVKHSFPGWKKKITTESRAWYKRHRSPSPSMTSHHKEEVLDEDPT